MSVYEQCSSEGCSRAQKRFWRADWIFFSRPHLARFFPRPSGVTTCNGKQRVHGTSYGGTVVLRTSAHSIHHLINNHRKLAWSVPLRDEEIQPQGTTELSRCPQLSCAGITILQIKFYFFLGSSYDHMWMSVIN